MAQTLGRAGVSVSTVLAVVYVLATTATLGYFILRIPMQVSDGFSNMVDVLNGSLLDIFVRKSFNNAYFRPLMWPPYRLVMDLSRGHYAAWFKGLQVAQVGVLLLLFVRWLRVRTGRDLVALPFAVAVLVGGQTFAGTVMEAFPINHFLAMAICVVAAATLAAEPRRWLNDVLALLVFAYGALTLESGLLVWVVLVWAWVLGWRGVSRPAIACITLGVVAYAAARVLVHTGAPDLLERGTGFGFSALGPSELQHRFGAHPGVLYAYNVACAVVGTLLAEPRGGVWRLTRSIVTHNPEPWTQLNVVCTSGVTLLAAIYAWRHRAAWRRRLFTHEDRIVLMLPAVVAANAVFCYAYIKEVVLAPAGVCLAAAGFVSLRYAVTELGRRRVTAGSLACAALIGALTCGWGVKQIGIHYALRKMNVAVRRDWAFVDGWLEHQHIELTTPAARDLKNRLQTAAIRTEPAPPWPPFPWSARWLDENQ